MSRGEKKSKRRRKRCRFCRRLFSPDPRVGSRQVACSNPECQRQRKKANQDHWLDRHPDSFKERYWNTTRWLGEHPGYLAEYRRQNPEKVARDNERRKIRREVATHTRADIQDSISAQPTVAKALAPYLAERPRADIQDSIWPQVIMASLFSAHFVNADIQDSIDHDIAAGVPWCQTEAALATPPAPADDGPRRGSDEEKTC